MSPVSVIEKTRRPAQQRQLSDYTELSRRIKAAGLLERRHGWYLFRCLMLLGGFGVAFTLLFTLGHTWWQLLVAALFGVLITQAAFLSHDGAHRQVFASGVRNEWFARVVGNLFGGLSYGWWMRKHSKHHANPNTIGKDEDIGTGAIVFDVADVAGRTGIVGWITARQGWLFFPMLTLEGLNLHASAVKTVFGRAEVKHRFLEGVLVGIRLIGFPVLVLWALGPGMGLAFMAVQLVVFGLYMGGSFAPSHKGMPMIQKDMSVDFLRRQVLTSRNILGGRPMMWVMGGLNYQVEHHLFPSMPSVNLHRARPIVRAYCAENDILYTEATLFESYGIVIAFLNRVGMGYADPFDCPFASQYRA